MILLDANLLVYAHVRGMPQHERSRAWLDEKLSGPAPVGLPWPALLAFVRLVTNPRVFERAEPAAAAWAQVEAWLEAGPAWVPVPGNHHREVLGGLLRGGDVVGNLVPDAQLAALAIEHGLVLCSTDGDFGRFRGLRWENPLAS